MSLLQKLRTYIVQPTYINLYNTSDIINKNCINEILQYVGIDNVVDFFIYHDVDSIETKYINSHIYNNYGVESNNVNNHNNEYYNKDNIKQGILNYIEIDEYMPDGKPFNVYQAIANNIIIYINTMIHYWISENNNTIFKLLYHKDNDDYKRRANIPSWIYLEYIKMITLDNIKLFHLTNTEEKANSIINNGFIYGVNDITKMGLSNYYRVNCNENNIKNNIGLNYAYMHDHIITDLHINSFGNYKVNFDIECNNDNSNNVMLVYHRVDKEQQVIFDMNNINKNNNIKFNPKYEQYTIK